MSPRFDRDRRALLGGALALPFVANLGCDAGPPSVPIAIVGAGLAGLHAAYRLKQRGLVATVYEADARIGGRVSTDRTTFFTPSGQHAELGGEIISSSDATMIDLAGEFSLALLDYRKGPSDTFFAGGAIVDPSELAPVLAAAQSALAKATKPGLPSYSDANGLGAYDTISISEWLVQVGASSAATAIVEAVYTAQRGLDCTQQSALNLITQATTTLFGARDRRYTIAVGNDALTSRLAAALDPSQIVLQERLAQVALRSDGRYTLSFDGGDEVIATHVVLAIPFSVLRSVQLVGIELPMPQASAIATLAYGTSTKVALGLSSQPRATIYGDLGFQRALATSELQPGNAGIVSFDPGGATGTSFAAMDEDMLRDTLLAQLDMVQPGIAGTSTGTVARATYPSGSVACYAVGQWTTLAGAEGLRAGNLLFAGEHTIPGKQGTMEAAAESGAIVADAIADDLGLGQSSVSSP